MKFSANLGYLWTELPLPQAIAAAAAAGFDAVEVHWPYDTPPAAVRAALAETGLPIISLNTRRGDRPGEFGLSALPGRADEARAAIDEAIAYAAAVGAGHVHVLAGIAAGPEAAAAFRASLRHASAAAAPHGIGLLIEALNPHDVPGYFLSSTDAAAALVAELDLPNLRLMFDCYHVQRSAGDVCRRLTEFLPLIGHVQFAGAPDRGRPDRGELCYRHVFAHLAGLGWAAPLGAEYRTGGPTEPTLDWMRTLPPR